MLNNNNIKNDIFLEVEGDPVAKTKLHEIMNKFDITEDDLNSIQLPANIIVEADPKTILEWIETAKEENLKNKEVLPNNELNHKKSKVYNEHIYDEVSQDDEMYNDEKQEEYQKVKKDNKIKSSKIKTTKIKNKTKEDEDNKEDAIKQKPSIADNVIDYDNIPVNNNISNINTLSSLDSLNKKRVYEVILPVSGYTASLRGLSVDEIDFLRSSAFNDYKAARDAIVSTVYKCIVKSSVGNMSFDSFLKNTAALDFNCLLFGIFIRTFGRLSNYTFICNNVIDKNSNGEDIECNHRFDKTIITEHLITNNSGKLLEEVIGSVSNAIDPVMAMEKSLLKTFNKRIVTPNSKIAIEFSFPNLVRDRSVLKSFGDQVDENIQNTRRFQILTYAKRALIPRFDENGVLFEFAPLSSIYEIYKVLEMMSSEDLDFLIESIANIQTTYEVTFSTPEDIVCPSCSRKIGKKFFPLETSFLGMTLGQAI